MTSYTISWLNELIEDKWGFSVQSTRAWHRFKSGGEEVIVRHVALGYAIEGIGSVAESSLCQAMWESLASLSPQGLLVMRTFPSLTSYKPAYDTNPPDYTKKEQTAIYLRLSFINGPTEEDLKGLPCYKPEGSFYVLLGS